jgi:hypothetical protein
VEVDEPGPQTLIGRWLRACALEQDTLVHILNDEIKRTGSLRDPALFQAVEQLLLEAAGMVIRKRFTPDTDVRVITAWVHELYTALGKIDVLAGEALVRWLLGEDIDITEIPASQVYLCLPFFFLRAFSQLYRDPVHGQDEVMLDNILSEAERRAAERGLQPIKVIDVPPISEE